MPFLPPDLFPFMLLIPKVLLHYFLSEQILENYCSLLKQAPVSSKRAAAGWERDGWQGVVRWWRSQISDLITIIEDRLKLAGAAEYTIEIIAWTL